MSHDDALYTLVQFVRVVYSMLWHLRVCTLTGNTCFELEIMHLRESFAAPQRKACRNLMLVLTVTCALLARQIPRLLLAKQIRASVMFCLADARKKIF